MAEKKNKNSPNISQIILLTLESMKKSMRVGGGGGGRQLDAPPSIFKSIEPIDMKLGVCDKFPVYLQLSIVTWHCIAFHGNHRLC